MTTRTSVQKHPSDHAETCRPHVSTLDRCSRATVRPVLRLLSEILTYPQTDLPEKVASCVTLLSKVDSDATALLERFCAFAAETPSGRLEEAYTSAFDLQAVCCPYVGYQIFGDSYKRGLFLAHLKDEYRNGGFAIGAELGNELPDHLAVILRFLAVLDDAGSADELVAHCLVPALGKMVSAVDDSGNP